MTDPSAVFKLVEVVNVTFDLPSPNPIVHLREDDLPYRVLYFPIALPEAVSISLALEHQAAPRPNAHDLLSQVLAATGTDIVALRLTGERDGTILAELDLMTPKGREVLDCRPSDGLAVVLRNKAIPPILCDETLLGH